MTGLIARRATRSPRAMLLGCLLATVALSVYAIGVPERLALGGAVPAGSEPERTSEALAAKLGYDPEPAYLLVLTASEPVDPAAAAVAIETVRGQAASVPGVAAVRIGRRAEGAPTATLGVHLKPDAGEETRQLVGERLSAGIDPGPFELLVGGQAATAEQAREEVLSAAVKLGLLGLPLLLLVLGATLGMRLGPASLLGALLAAVAAVSLLGVLDRFGEIEAIAVAVAVGVAIVVAVEASTSLIHHHRDHAERLGHGVEALDRSLRAVIGGALIGALSAILVGAGLYAIPIPFVQSVGIGVIVAAVVAPPLALGPVAAVIALPAGGAARRAEAAPAARSPGPVAGLMSRLVSGAGRRRHAAGLLLVAGAITVALSLPLLDPEAIGLDAAELPAERAAARADAELAGAFGPGGGGPLTVAAEDPPGTPALALYRDAVGRLPGVESVSLAVPAGELAAFDVIVDSRPRSLGAQATAAAIVNADRSASTALTGPAAEVRAAAVRLGADLPLVLVVALGGTAALWSLLLRSALGPALALAAAPAPLCGLGAMALVFGEGRLSGPLDYAPAGAPHLASFVLVGAALLAVALWRGAQTATALRRAGIAEGGSAGALVGAVGPTWVGAAAGSLVGIIAAALWLAAPLTVAKEIALGLSVGLLADLLLSRTMIVPGLAGLVPRRPG